MDKQLTNAMHVKDRYTNGNKLTKWHVILIGYLSYYMSNIKTVGISLKKIEITSIYIYGFRLYMSIKYYDIFS